MLGFAAQTGSIDFADGMLYAGLFFWTLGYGTIYSHQDKDDDALIGVKSPVRPLGARSHHWILAFYAIAFTLILAARQNTSSHCAAFCAAELEKLLRYCTSGCAFQGK